MYVLKLIYNKKVQNSNLEREKHFIRDNIQLIVMIKGGNLLNEYKLVMNRNSVHFVCRHYSPFPSPFKKKRYRI